MITDIDAIKNVFEKIKQKKIDDAKKIINDKCPFIPPIEKEERISFTEEDKTELLWRDGFIDRYSTTREKLIHPAVLRILSECMPVEFPWDSHWNMEKTHIAYYQLSPSVDHVIPHARGGTNEKDNLVCTSYLRNLAKSGYTLEELGWEVQPEGDHNEWDGMTKWFMEYVEENKMEKDPYLKPWYGAALKYCLD